MKYFKKKNRIYNSILLSMSILFSSHAFASDLVPNEEVNGSNGRIVTGLSYLIGANTVRSGMLYMEANPGDTRIRPTRYNENATDAQDWRWFFTPTNYRLSAVIQNFNYEGADLNALLDQAGDNFSQIAIERETNENRQRQGEIDIQKTSSRETTYSFSWSFNSSETTRLSHNLSVQVNYTPPFGIGGIGGSVGYGLGHESEKSFSASTVHSENASTTESTTVSYRVASRTRLTTTRRQTHNTLDIPFSARCTFSALADRARKNGTIASMVPVDNQGIRALLKHEGLLSENQHLQEDNTIIIRGILTAGYSLSETIFGEEPLDVVMP